MIYQGSKARIVKHILPFIQNCITRNGVKLYIEPFVGGANVIQHVRCMKKVGIDKNAELIELLKYMQQNPTLQDLPEHCPVEHYNEVREARKLGNGQFPVWYTAAIGYFASYGGRYFDGGYGRGVGRDIYHEHLEHAREQAPSLKDVDFIASEYNKVNFGFVVNHGFMIYCDPPYRHRKRCVAGLANYDDFYMWLKVLGKKHFVLVSEYSMPHDFVCLWEKEVTVLQKSNAKCANFATERLFTPRNGLYDRWRQGELLPV